MYWVFDIILYLIKDQYMNTKLQLLEKEIAILAKKHRAGWKGDLWESEKIEEYGLNEFMGGKADAYEDCLDLIKKCIKVS